MVNRCAAGLLTSTILAVGGAPPLNAQTSPSPAPADAASAGDPGAITAAPDTAQLEEIVVTAPQAHGSAARRADLDRRSEWGGASGAELQATLPTSSSRCRTCGSRKVRSAPRSRIRGVYWGINQGFEQSVATYIDGVHPRPRAAHSRMPFLDVERVEVLRGPQSILFGKNAIAGALNITSAPPKSPLSGPMQWAVYSSPITTSEETTGVVWGPLTDKVRARVAAPLSPGATVTCTI